MYIARILMERTDEGNVLTAQGIIDALAAYDIPANRQVYISGCAKTLNDTVYYSIDAIHAAINEGRKISFMYFDYSTKMQRVYRKGGKAYVRTPIALCWNEDKYYLLTYCPDFSDPYATYRVDRMANVGALDEEADRFERESFNVADFIRKTFGMYNGETVLARLAFHESLVCVVLDHFGNGTDMAEIGDGRFLVKAEVSGSPVFLGWMFQLGDKAEILAPESLRAAMRDMIATGHSIYGE